MASVMDRSCNQYFNILSKFQPNVACAMAPNQQITDSRQPRLKPISNIFWAVVNLVIGGPAKLYGYGNRSAIHSNSQAAKRR
ncbi:hypothetical protein ACLOJK_022350, partial [Asimina triloba]